MKLFDHTVLPILTYSAEIWGYENSVILERIHCEFMRKILHLRKSTPLYMLYAETGRHPIELTIKCRMISFWNRIITGDENKLAHKLYKYMLNLPNFNSKWISKIKEILAETGRNDLWINQYNQQLNSSTLKTIIKQRLLDQNLQRWHASLNDSNKGKMYSTFKENIKIEGYLTSLNNRDALNLLKFRTGNHRFPVETGRWSGIDISERKCQLCQLNDVGDEFHYLLKCTFFEKERKTHISRYYYTRPNLLKFKELLTGASNYQLSRACKFIKILLKAVQ